MTYQKKFDQKLFEKRLYTITSHTNHKKFGGIELSLGAGGLRFKKRPSAFNVCIGKEMKGTTGPALGRYDEDYQKKFIKAAVDCGATLTPAAKKKWGL
jgi:hypothetical protein